MNATVNLGLSLGLSVLFLALMSAQAQAADLFFVSARSGGAGAVAGSVRISNISTVEPCGSIAINYTIKTSSVGHTYLGSIDSLESCSLNASTGRVDIKARFTDTAQGASSEECIGDLRMRLERENGPSSAFRVLNANWLVDSSESSGCSRTRSGGVFEVRR